MFDTPPIYALRTVARVCKSVYKCDRGKHVREREAVKFYDFLFQINSPTERLIPDGRLGVFRYMYWICCAVQRFSRKCPGGCQVPKHQRVDQDDVYNCVRVYVVHSG